MSPADEEAFMNMTLIFYRLWACLKIRPKLSSQGNLQAQHSTELCELVRGFMIPKLKISCLKVIFLTYKLSENVMKKVIQFMKASS